MTMLIVCPHCRHRQDAPMAVADGTDKWPCEECGLFIELPRRYDLTKPKEVKDERAAD